MYVPRACPSARGAAAAQAIVDIRRYARPDSDEVVLVPFHPNVCETLHQGLYLGPDRARRRRACTAAARVKLVIIRYSAVGDSYWKIDSVFNGSKVSESIFGSVFGS